jgi:hypothetical protein
MERIGVGEYKSDREYLFEEGDIASTDLPDKLKLSLVHITASPEHNPVLTDKIQIKHLPLLRNPPVDNRVRQPTAVRLRLDLPQQATAVPLVFAAALKAPVRLRVAVRGQRSRTEAPSGSLHRCICRIALWS